MPKLTGLTIKINLLKKLNSQTMIKIIVAEIYTLQLYQKDNLQLNLNGQNMEDILPHFLKAISWKMKEE